MRHDAKPAELSEDLQELSYFSPLICFLPKTLGVDRKI